MITTLAIFSSQFDPLLIEKGKALFDEKQISSITREGLNYTATVTDQKNYDLTVRIEKGKVTDIFCACSPKICRHIIAMLFSLQQQLHVEPISFDPSHLDTPEYVLLGRRLNDMIHSNRAAGSQYGQLEKLGKELKLYSSDVKYLRTLVMDGWYMPNPHSHYPLLHGARKMLGAAILKYEQEQYEFVFDIARAILTEVCSGGSEMNGWSGYDSAFAAIEIMRTLMSDKHVPEPVRNNVRERVNFAANKELYHRFHHKLKEILTTAG